MTSARITLRTPWRKSASTLIPRLIATPMAAKRARLEGCAPSIVKAVIMMPNSASNVPTTFERETGASSTVPAAVEAGGAGFGPGRAGDFFGRGKGIRSLLKYPCAPRESALGWMARRERRAYPQRSVRSEQRRQTAQSALALRVASLFGLACVAPQSQTAAGMLLRRALARPKIEATRGTWVFQQTPRRASRA